MHSLMSDLNVLQIWNLNVLQIWNITDCLLDLDYSINDIDIQYKQFRDLNYWTLFLFNNIDPCKKLVFSISEAFEMRVWLFCDCFHRHRDRGGGGEHGGHVPPPNFSSKFPFFQKKTMGKMPLWSEKMEALMKKCSPPPNFMLLPTPHFEESNFSKL
jgi:hypothetical protein